MKKLTALSLLMFAVVCATAQTAVKLRNPTTPAAKARLADTCVQSGHANAQTMAQEWGATLTTEGMNSRNARAARAQWRLAYDRFALAISINPKQQLASYNLASAMLAERAALLKAPLASSTQTSAEAADLLQRARKILLDNADDPKAKGAYNLACVYALDGRVADAMQWLRRSTAADSLPAKSHIAQDSDLDSMRSTPEFAAWFAQLP